MSNIYLHRFFRMNTAPLLLSEKVFPNLKEITESMAAFIAIQTYLKINRNADNVDVFVIGDGHSPRTAALIACLTKWYCSSIDPVLKDKTWNFKRVTIYKDKIENLQFDGLNQRIAIIVCVHSHAKISNSLKSLINFKERHLINIPCCVQPDINNIPDFRYVDTGIHSTKNEVFIYKNI